MTLYTIERNIKYTTKSYFDIYKSAEKRGLKVIWKKDGEYTDVIAYDNTGHFARSVFCTDEPTQAIYNEYCFPKK